MLRPDEELKLYLFEHGLKIGADAERTWLERYGGPLSLSEYASTSGICIYTLSDVWINAPFIEAFTETSAAVLDIVDGEFAVRLGDDATQVRVVPVPRYHETSYTDPADGTAHPYTNLGVTHTDRCRISPIEGCAWRCTFCDLPYDFAYRRKPKDELLKVIELAVLDHPQAHHVLISGGTPRPADEPWIDDIYGYIAQNSPIPVDVMMPARSDLNYPAWLRSVGVNMLSVNLEISDQTRARRITPHKARQYTREEFLDYVEAAVEVFGVGQVQSLMVFGDAIESAESTLEGVRDLAERGCVPVLSPFRPDASTPLGRSGASPPTSEDMKRIWLDSWDLCAKSATGVKPGPRCIPCQHNTVTFSDGSDFYVPLGGDLTAR